MAFFQRRLAATAAASALLAALALPAFAQGTPPAPAPGAATAQAPRGPAHGMREHRMEKFAAHLKAKLQLTAEQEGAWTTYTAAMKPQQQARVDFQGMKNLTTPERIDRMRTLRTQHAAEADRRGEATKAFYAQLSPAQQKTFDEQTAHAMGRMHRKGPGHERGHHGHPPAPQQ